MEHKPAPPHSDETDGLWIALVLDGTGGARELAWDAIDSWKPDDGPLWIHLHPRAPRAIAWLDSERSLPEAERSALRNPDASNPQLQALGTGAFLISLRGLAPETERDSRDLSLLRMLAEPHRVVSCCDRWLPGVVGIRDLFRTRNGPRDIPELIAAMAAGLAALLRDNALDLEDPMTELEYAAETEQDSDSSELGEMQTTIARLRRHVAPYKILVARFLAMPDAWLVSDHLPRWRHLADQLQEADSLLQNMYERAKALRDLVGERLARRMNYILYVLTVLTTIMLPLTFVTGLFGMNVGIEGGSYRFMQAPLTFLGICAALGVLAWVEYRFIKRRQLL